MSNSDSSLRAALLEMITCGLDMLSMRRPELISPGNNLIAACQYVQSKVVLEEHDGLSPSSAEVSILISHQRKHPSIRKMLLDLAHSTTKFREMSSRYSQHGVYGLAVLALDDAFARLIDSGTNMTPEERHKYDF